MKALAYYVFSVSAATLLAACGGSQPLIGSPGATPQTLAIGAPQFSPKANGVLVFPFRVLHAFSPSRGGNDGATPQARLIAFHGKLYGTTWTGGATDHWGTVYEIDPTGHERTVYSFLGGYSSPDGGNPYSGVTASGNLLYGTTFAGGTYNDGIVFSVTTAGTETVVHTFGGNGDGSLPAGDLLAYKGMLYGSTTDGGSGTYCGSYCGTLFSITASGSEKIVHSFNGKDGAQPYGGLIDVHGMFYGTTSFGSRGSGTVFAVSPDGHKFRTLHIFPYDGSGGDGANPYGTLLFTHGALYGTTSAGGAHGDGTIFKLSLNGTESILYSFTGAKDGYGPHGGLIVVNNALVGAAASGGWHGYGTIFSVDLQGHETTLHAFNGTNDGEDPQDTLLYYKGDVFGTAWTGGADQFGTVFRYKPEDAGTPGK